MNCIFKADNVCLYTGEVCGLVDGVLSCCGVWLGQQFEWTPDGYVLSMSSTQVSREG